MKCQLSQLFSCGDCSDTEARGGGIAWRRQVSDRLPGIVSYSVVHSKAKRKRILNPPWLCLLSLQHPLWTCLQSWLHSQCLDLPDLLYLQSAVSADPEPDPPDTLDLELAVSANQQSNLPDRQSAIFAASKSDLQLPIFCSALQSGSAFAIGPLPDLQSDSTRLSCLLVVLQNSFSRCPCPLFAHRRSSACPAHLRLLALPLSGPWAVPQNFLALPLSSPQAVHLNCLAPPL
ncbi:uncharacterized protein LOC121881857 isoform X1 [Thunnus maccoyii]|uniref:uncharacterized protein LOC121881857 isoform X1 n=1 Tax=Thunnus maccoyii TaxID=8240 RepID=UPI001C4A95F5|nr:uncharacterized protein LOC121881857 isoform X1 [Thunnus maccoyii]